MLLLARSNLPPPGPALALLPRCKTLRDVEQLHARLITSGFLRHPSLAAGVVIRLSSSPHPASHLLSRRLFFSLPIPTDPFLWNALIKSSSHGRDPNQAVLIFALMLAAGITADEFSYSLALKACSRASLLREGSQIHSLIRKTELSSNLYLQNSLISFYSRCGLYELARQVFDRIPDRDSVSWNSMIDGYVKNGSIGAAKELFDQLTDEDKNLVTWNSMIGGFVSETNGIGIDMARQLFDEMPERDLVSWNSMIDGYARCGRMGDAEDLFERMMDRDVISWANMIYGYMEAGSVALARKLFDEMPERDVITWNIMMSGYVKNGNSAEALNLFSMMRLEGSVAPDNATLASVLSAISELGRIHDGIAIHEYIERNCLPLDGKLGVALIDMYSKCGRLEDALEVFEISGRSVDHWNAMICGLAVHGCGELALKLFWQMERCLVVPDDITFIGVLNACSHSGLVEEGLMCFEMMKRDYNLEPKVQHYGCMVDVLGRAGRLEEAMKLIKNMPVEPNDVVWRSLLSACRNHRNFDMGQKVVKNIIEGDTCNSSSYVLLSNLYASIGMWGDVSKVRMIMREKDLRKVPGCSWIELDGVVHEFVVGDNSHLEAKGIYSFLESLCKSKLYSSHVL